MLRLRHWFAPYFSTFVRKYGLTRIRLDVLELRLKKVKLLLNVTFNNLLRRSSAATIPEPCAT